MEIVSRTKAVTLTGSPTRSTTSRITAVLLSLTTKSVWPRKRSVADSEAAPGMASARINPASRRTGSIPTKTPVNGDDMSAARCRRRSALRGAAYWCKEENYLLHIPVRGAAAQCPVAALLLGSRTALMPLGGATSPMCLGPTAEPTRGPLSARLPDPGDSSQAQQRQTSVTPLAPGGDGRCSSQRRLSLLQGGIEMCDRPSPSSPTQAAFSCPANINLLLSATCNTSTPFIHVQALFMALSPSVLCSH
ncbi:hypothetical protein EYF80_039546 [Liparis tanakae]|uniref:Uncharacterized protein n=1 Tax=Liparis tanakae TaxID=230148 RepID=A0A4Z2GAL9_9TELE|nr:hypothetical protein EYF80_039546 [Liparis tanakae]